MCPTALGTTYSSVTWFVSQHPDQYDELDVSADGLSRQGVDKLRIEPVRPDHEGKYFCSIDQEESKRSVWCLFVIGEA